MTPSPELRAKELIAQMSRMASEVNPDINAMVDCMVAAAKLLAELPTHGLSSPRRHEVNGAIAMLTKLLEVLAALVKKHISDLQKGGAGSGAAGVFKPRF